MFLFRQLTLIALLSMTSWVWAHQARTLKPSFAHLRGGCELRLSSPSFGDIYQYDDQIGEVLGIDQRTLRRSGLCGPVCTVNAIFSQDGRRRALRELGRLIKFAERKLRISRARVLSGSYAGEVAHFLNAALIERDGQVPEIDIHMERVFSPGETEIPAITIDSFRAANYSDTVVIGLIHQNDPRFEVRTDRNGHYIQVEEFFEFKSKMLALIRDPEFRRPYWVEIVEYSRDASGAPLFRLIDIEGWGNYPHYVYRDEAVTLLSTLIIARRNL